MSARGRPEAVVFDLDGTLLDSLPLVLAAITHAVEPYGARPTMEIFAQLGGPPERFLLPMVEHVRNLPGAMERLASYHRDNAHLIQPYDGVADLLTRVRSTGVQAALWTGRDRSSAQWLLQQHRLEAHFSTIVCGDDLPTHKPDPAGLQEIMRRLGVQAEQTLFVGDADVDVLGGAGCGVDTILIQHARRIEPHILDRTWRTVRSPGEAFDLVLRRVQSFA
jgi:HAD superfamily hydrolase (TIGR01509 family)